MKAHIRIIQLENQFEAYSFKSNLADKNKDIVNFEFDNFSEKQLLTYGLKLLEESEETAIEVEMKENAGLGLLPFFFRKAIAQKQKIKLKYRGENKVLYKLLLPFKPNVIND